MRKEKQTPVLDIIGAEVPPPDKPEPDPVKPAAEQKVKKDEKSDKDKVGESQTAEAHQQNKKQAT